MATEYTWKTRERISPHGVWGAGTYSKQVKKGVKVLFLIVETGTLLSVRLNSLSQGLSEDDIRFQVGAYRSRQVGLRRDMELRGHRAIATQLFETSLERYR